MTEYIEKQLDYFVNRRDHKRLRREIPVDLTDILADPALSDEEKATRAHARVMRSEEIVVFPWERIAGTRVMLRLPEFPHGSYGYLDGRISHMLNEPTIGGISNNVAEYGHAITVGLEGLRAEVSSRLGERGEEEEAEAVMGNAFSLLLLLGVSLAAFLLMSASPLDPLQTNVGQAALGAMSQEQIAQLEDYWGVNDPPLQRYLGWLADALHGDLGTSLLYRQPVLTIIGERLGNSLGLLLFAWVLSGVLGLALGVTAGALRGRWPDRLIRGWCLLISSTPAFWLAILLLLVFSVWLGWFPTGLSVPIGVDADSVTFLERLHHAVLPALTLSITGVSSIALHTREKMVDVMESDYVLFARARGESLRSIVLRHGVRNVALPAITLQFASVSEIIGGSVLVEQVFSYPGLGQAAVTAGLGSDLPLLLGITVITAAIVFGGNLIADLLYGAVNPKIRRGAAKS